MAIFPPPTSRLPPIRSISSHPTSDLIVCLRYLRLIYNPEVRGSRRRRTSIPRGKAIQQLLDVPSNMDLEELRLDAFERAYAIRWLTTLISQAELWESNGKGEDGQHPGLNPSSQIREGIIQDAASLLAICAGTAAAGIITREFSFARHTGQIKVQLTDVPLENQDYGSVGAQTWGGACVLAEMIAREPEQFGLSAGGDASKKTMKILELGAGTGLVSLAVGKVIQDMPEFASRSVTVVATDYYPSVLVNLEDNLRSNFPSAVNKVLPTGDDGRDSLHILAHALDWSQFPDSNPHLPPFDEPFDLVLGADIIYEARHAIWIKSCLTTLLRKPSLTRSEPNQPMFHLIIPLRATHTSESSTIETVFKRCEGMELAVLSREIIICDAESGRDGEEVEYAYYQIGWCL